MTRSVVSRTALAVGVVPRRSDARLVFGLASAAYLLVYLFTVGDLTLTGRGGLEALVVPDLSRALVSTGFFRFDAVAAVEAGPVRYLFSPLNLVVALALAALVGLNLALTYLGWTQPRACGLESSGGVLAGIPALLSGAACCGPTLLLVLGVQASAALIAGFQLLVPVAIVLLLGGLLLIGRQVDPTLV